MKIETRKETNGDKESWVCFCEALNITSRENTEYFAKLSFLSMIQNKAIVALEPWPDDGPLPAPRPSQNREVG